MGKRVICISHATGAGGEEVGRAVAQRLGLRYIDEQIILTAAAEGRVSPDAVIDAERHKSLLERLASDDSDHERRLIRQAIAATAEQGEVVIVAHAASYALGAQPGVLRVLVTAPAETRAERNGDDVKGSDAGRAAYLKSFYDVRDEQPTDYDLVVNTERIETARAAELIAAAAG